MRLSYCLMLVLLLGSSYVMADSNMTTEFEEIQDENSLVTSINGLLTVIEELPVIGSLVKKLIKGISELIVDFELITNGVLGRVLGGALPCTLSIPNHLVCRGVDPAKGGVGKLMMMIIKDIPNLLLPSFIKKIIGVIISAFIDPTFDVTFGGIDIA